MPVKKKDIPGQDTKSDSGISINLDFSDWLRPDAQNIVPDVSTVHYSNHSLVQVMDRDLFIDFLQLPGIKKDEKHVVDVTRIYLTHSHAQKLAQAIQRVLKKSYDEHNFETYSPEK